jgi:uncharacterized protein YkwD
MFCFTYTEVIGSLLQITNFTLKKCGPKLILTIQKPNNMRSILLILLSCILVSFKPTSNFGDKYEFLKLLNEYRASKGLNFLQYDQVLEKAAQLQCEYNYRQHNEGGHDNLNPNCTTVYNRVYQVGYKPSKSYPNYICKENCVVYLNASQTRVLNIEKNILESYKKSDGHNQAMLKDNIEKIGYYTIYDGKDIYNIIVMAN